MTTVERWKSFACRGQTTFCLKYTRFVGELMVYVRSTVGLHDKPRLFVSIFFISHVVTIRIRCTEINVN